MGRQPYVYRPRTAEDVARRKQETNSETPNVFMDQFKVYQSRKGENWIRILPATWEDAHHYGLDLWLHYNIGPDRNAVLCLNRMLKQPCPPCEQRLLAERAGDEDEAKDLRPRRRCCVWIVDRQAEQEGPQLYSMPATLDEEIQTISTDKTDGTYYLVDDPFEGYDVMFEKVGTGINTKYNGVQIARRASGVDPAYIEYIAEYPIPQCLIWRPYEEVMELFGAGMRSPSSASGNAAPQFGRRPVPGAGPATGPGPMPPPRQGVSGPAPQQWQNPGAPPAASGRPPGGFARPGMPPSGPPQSPPPRRPLASPPQTGYAPPQAQQWQQPAPQQEQYDNDPNAPPWTGEAPPPNGPADYGFDPANSTNEYGEPQQQQYDQQYTQPQLPYGQPQQQYAPPQQQGGYMPQPPPRQPPQGQVPQRGAAGGAGGFQPPRPPGPQTGMQQRSPAEVAAQLRPRMPQR